MRLATLDKSPPPFFRQGPTALSKLLFFSALAFFLMVSDSRFEFARPLRAGLATALLPVQQVLMVPVRLWQGAVDYAQGLTSALQARDAAQARLASQSERAARAEQSAHDNERLRALLELRPALAVRSLAAEVMYEASDPYSRKIFIDRGSTHGVVEGAPVVSEGGVLGQVTRAYPLNAEVTLLTDQHAAIPVLNARTRQRSAAYGGTAGTMELRFMAANADVQVGDVLHTSGVDGVYPPGLAVARVLAVERRGEAGFARIALKPSAHADGVRHVLVLEPTAAQLPARVEASVAPPERGSRAARAASAAGRMQRERPAP